MYSRIILVLSCIAALFSFAHAQTYTQPPVTNYWGPCYNDLPAGYSSTDVPAHLQWTRFLLDNIDYSLDRTLYVNNNWTVWWGNYSCNAYFYSATDCSGLITATLARAYNYSLSSRNWAYTYANAASAGTKGWVNIPIKQAQVGDLLSIDYYYVAGSTSSGNTGHNGYLNALPYVFNPQQEPFVANTTQYAIPLLDQTSTPHGSNDSRYTVGAKGIGTGSLRVYVDDNTGATIGYTWSINSTVYYNQSYNSVWIGRLNSTYTITADEVAAALTTTSSSSSGSTTAASPSTTGTTDSSPSSFATSVFPVAFFVFVASLLAF